MVVVGGGESVLCCVWRRAGGRWWRAAAVRVMAIHCETDRRAFSRGACSRGRPPKACCVRSLADAPLSRPDGLLQARV